MKTIINLWLARLAVVAAFAALAAAQPVRAASPEWHFECSGGVPNKLCWQSKAGETYDLWRSDDLAVWSHVEGYPKAGSGGMMEHPFTPGARGFFRIVSEASVPEGFALIPAGSFLMGDQASPYSNERPVHTVQVSAFFMGKYEVTKEEWDAVRAWGLANGYTDLAAGNGSYASKGANHPVHSIPWYDVTKWCNARSEKEGLAPCYTVEGTTYKTGSSAPVCNWSANGYRLPTEAEWEKAARGGVSGKRFPWGTDTITHGQANYLSDSSYAYDVSPTRGYHPIYNDGVTPYSSPVGSFAPNGYGLYDMAGNMWEWCWDLYGSYAAGSQTDPRGAASGSGPVFRGGGWDGVAGECRVAGRGYYDSGPANGGSNFGFRLARSSVTQGPPKLAASPDLIMLGVERGKTGTSALFVWNEGAGQIGFSLVVSNPGWMSVSPGSGTATAEPQPVVLSFDTSSLSVGQHQGTISVRDSADNSEAAVIHVTLTVVDQPVVEGFALIPAGPFQMGDQSSPLVGGDDEVPVHTVQVSAFYMGKYEVTKEVWDAVRTWGTTNGYTDLAAGNGSYASKGANHPVHSITWYDMVKWCNARSEKEGMTPCYTVSGEVYRTGTSDAVACNWSANGYRLPTEAEWEKAARGGVAGKNFPWGGKFITHSQANYYSDSDYAYDKSPTRGYHPTYATGTNPYTSPVGSFAPNGYGLYDMAGNVWEWCWDWYGSYPSTSQTDPRGAASGSYRVVRGGSWGSDAEYCRAAARFSNSPTGSNNRGIGFRVARSSVP